ncbi:MAG TPA: MFS transporter [Woeseiaceae bacterium]|nr:MFS transporter [Woeseiaceae bacterium]
MNDAKPAPGPIRDLYDLLTGDEDARVCRDIPDASCREQPRNFLVHVAALTATKCGDWLASPKLVLAWLLTLLGAPAFMLGLLVPVRESLSLVPQLFVASAIRRVAVRKWFWVAGSIVQGLAVGAMALLAGRLEGAAAGWGILLLLVVFSLARGVCSVASKDVLGKTIAKTRRGIVNGYAASAAGAVVVAVGIGGFLPGRDDAGLAFFLAMLGAAALLWLIAALIYSQLAEYAGATAGGGNAIREAIAQLRLIASDRKLRNFVTVRALLLSTALVAPFYVGLANTRSSGALPGLGALMIAAGLAGFLSAPLWGRLADRSSRTVMARAALLAALTGGLTFIVAASGNVMVERYWYPGAYFLLCIAHAGIRLGRKTHLVDMASAETRASYVAVSNTIIGVLLLAGGALSSAVALFGAPAAILVLSFVALTGAIGAWRLDEAQA